ncbi:hypothetical protein KEM56_001538, partial [Ascosphaera pollenicola]
MVKRITSLVPTKPSTIVKDSWDRLTGHTTSPQNSPPAYEELYPQDAEAAEKSDYDLKHSSPTEAAVEAAADAHFEAAESSSSAAHRGGKDSKALKDASGVQITRKNISRDQHEQLRMTHEHKLKRIGSDLNLFLVWIPLFVVIMAAMLKNFIPDAWDAIVEGYQALKGSYVAFSQSAELDFISPNVEKQSGYRVTYAWGATVQAISALLDPSNIIHEASEGLEQLEYTDPSGIFFEVQPLLESILPLRSLHWKSPTRPLRSIDSLQVDFVPADNAQTNRSRSSSVPHRRHQIPGLRQTPYVKIYLLRCDDNDTYKTVSRKLVRDWIKDNASANQSHPPNSGNNQSFQDNHDAFEWLIVHVAPEGIDSSPNSALKWTGRATTSVLEKVRADFNGSSKSAVDRVTQLRIPKGGWLSRKTPEQEAQVEDLILKLKFAILTAFSLRINQYEEDIREKDSQRGLPGWNFCTFFMLKEGLVLGFEHVGLYDDALVGYDELSVGLDSALRDQIIDGNQHGGTFLEYDPDIFAKLEDALKSLSIEGGSVPEASDEAPRKNEENEDPAKRTSDVPTCISLERNHFPFDAQKKQYREMILANNISDFDFKVYIFTRQMTLLLKAARYNSPKNRTRGAHADLSLLAEVCDRASEFISYASRTLRHDLLKGLGTLDHACSDEVAEELVDNLVCSWTYAAVSQVLLETTSPLLDIGDLSLVHNGDKMAAAALSAFVSEKRLQLPRRSSSLSNLGTPAPQSPRSPSLRQPSPSSIAGGGSINRTGSLDLAATRGDLFLLARRVLDKVGKRRCWSQRWNDLSLLYLDDKGQGLNFDDVSLDETESEPEKQSSGSSAPVSNGLETPILADAAKSSTAFNQLYEDLTDQLFRHYFSAGRIRSSEMALVDLALSKYRAGDYTTAYRFFEHLTAFYGGHRWFALEGIALELYAECLKKTERMDEYVQGLLKLLANYAGIAQSGKKAISTNRKRQSTAAPLSFSNIADRKITQYVDELLETSKTLQTTPRTQLSHFFGGLVVHSSIVHFDRRDGIGIEVSLRFLLGKRVQAKHIKLYLVDPTNIGMSICFERSDETIISSSSTKILLEAP